ncbi:hypothetical protein F2P81_014567 [Scophthalmus maximus]|uniref:Uncharacterized protein n=1 Tax=Scophthalmus maximus TaxID=52904 RepID=A0A6A4SGE5_SCOMX|nr:hypothetical protein F2P81_014567 [Scophthalmus maximus]
MGGQLATLCFSGNGVFLTVLSSTRVRVESRAPGVQSRPKSKSSITQVQIRFSVRVIRNEFDVKSIKVKRVIRGVS